jgi:hypothetical protein
MAILPSGSQPVWAEPVIPDARPGWSRPVGVDFFTLLLALKLIVGDVIDDLCRSGKSNQAADQAQAMSWDTREKYQFLHR